MNPVVDIIYGGQFGSESKRLFIEYYVNKYKPDTIVSNFGPNSGGYLSDGSKWSSLPMGFNGNMLLSPGSIIDVDDFLNDYLFVPKTARVYIHQNACIINDKDLEDEKKLIKIGSTMTGTMSAVIRKMKRDPLQANGTMIQSSEISSFSINNDKWFNILRNSKRVLLVVPQGHSLSINFGFYPYCTSRNTSPQQGLADAGIPIHWVSRIIGCFRSFPIRVANRYDTEGTRTGWSGPCYNDQKETTWEDVGQPPEYTSISKKIRRVFNFSFLQLIESCQMNGCTDIFLNFLNYLTFAQQENLIYDIKYAIRDNNLGTLINWFGYGPTINDIMETPHDRN